VNNLKVIHVARKELGLDEDTYRALLQRVTGVASLKAMSEAQRAAVVKEMTRLGFKVKVAGKKLPQSFKPWSRMIHALWKNCHQLGVIEDRSPAALRAFCKRFIAHGHDGVVVDPDLLSYDQASPIIEALKKMEKRGKAARGGGAA
jgi:phage gp16-like protein